MRVQKSFRDRSRNSPKTALSAQRRTMKVYVEIGDMAKLMYDTSTILHFYIGDQHIISLICGTTQGGPDNSIGGLEKCNRCDDVSMRVYLWQNSHQGFVSFSVPHLNPLSFSYHYATFKYTYGVELAIPTKGNRTIETNAQHSIAKVCPRV